MYQISFLSIPGEIGENVKKQVYEQWPVLQAHVEFSFIFQNQKLWNIVEAVPHGLSPGWICNISMETFPLLQPILIAYSSFHTGEAPSSRPEVEPQPPAKCPPLVLVTVATCVISVFTTILFVLLILKVWLLIILVSIFKLKLCKRLQSFAPYLQRLICCASTQFICFLHCCWRHQVFTVGIFRSLKPLSACVQTYCTPVCSFSQQCLQFNLIYFYINSHWSGGLFSSWL